MPIVIDGLELAPASFYLRQMQSAIDVFEEGRTADIALPILSFFSGAEQKQPFATISPGHIHIFIEDKEVQYAIECEPSLYIRWAEVIFFYFREMAACPELASNIWMCCWLILNMFEEGGNTLQAYAHLASWAAAYDEDYAVIARNHIKKMDLFSEADEVSRSLILSTSINKGQDDFEWHVRNAFDASEKLHCTDRLHAYINYYCHIRPSKEILGCIISTLGWLELKDYRKGKMGLLELVVWTMQKNNNYEDLLLLLRSLKPNAQEAGFTTSHAFIFPNMHEKFTALKRCENISFTDRNNGESYADLMRICNQLNGVAISILGEKELNIGTKCYDSFGFPSKEGRFETLRQAIVDHYHLKDEFYKELNVLTLIPSHNHPIQGALCSLGYIPPLLSTSLENLVDESDARQFVFFLASSTYTYSIELEWLQGKFGEKAIIYTDPAPEVLISILNDAQFTHIYISAHGEYDHWERSLAKIHFSEAAESSIEDLSKTHKNWKYRRTLILNICDGATSRLSYNPNNTGLAAALASGAQVVISHLWPVNPKYAACFGLLFLEQIDNGLLSPSEAILNVYTMLNRSNGEIADFVQNIGHYCEDLANMIRNTDFEISDFKNIGAIAIYT